jgi:hypothetical protein
MFIGDFSGASGSFGSRYVIFVDNETQRSNQSFVREIYS